MNIRHADFISDLADIRRVRFAVFVDEQKVPAEIEMDDRDPVCIHLLALDAEQAVGTARIDLGRAGKVGRLAVLASHRRQGVGMALMRGLHQIAVENQLKNVWCNAQVSAVPFYQRLGYQVSSGPFYEADIEHVKMECDI
jgi:predicted GNAT family N-acyltransferase